MLVGLKPAGVIHPIAFSSGAPHLIISLPFLFAMPLRCYNTGVGIAAGSVVRCAFFDKDLHSRMPLSFTPLLRLKRCHACDQWHTSRVSTASYRFTI